MPRLYYTEEQESLDDLLPTDEVIAARAREAGMDDEYRIRCLFNFIVPHEDTMAEYYFDIGEGYET